MRILYFLLIKYKNYLLLNLYLDVFCIKYILVSIYENIVKDMVVSVEKIISIYYLLNYLIFLFIRYYSRFL